MRHAFSAAVCVALLAATATADITIDTPADPIAVGQSVQIRVDGLDQADLPKAVVDHHPTDKTIVLPAYTWGGRPFILFQAQAAGQYALWVAVPRADAIDYAKAVITVGTPKPDPEPDPDPSPIPGKRWVLIVDETNNPTFEGRNLLAQIRADPPAADTWILDPDDTDPWARPYLDLVDRAALPQILIIADDDGGVIVHQGPLPASVDAVKALVKTHGG